MASQPRTGRTGNIKWLIGCAMLPGMTACGGAGLNRTAKHEGDWSSVKEGTTVILYAKPGTTCETRIAGSREELVRNPGAALSTVDWSHEPSPFVIVESWAEDVGNSAPDLYLKLKEADGSKQVWLYSKTSSSIDCVFPNASGLVEARRLVDKTYVWAPWRGSCTDITAGGPGFSTLIASPPSGSRLEAQSVEIRGEVAVVSFDAGNLLVTPSTLANCFAPANDPTAKSPDPLALGLLRIDPKRCDTDVFEGNVHVACRSTVGIWNRDRTGLHAIRRTIGPIHFLGGAPVTGRGFARAVVSIDTGKAQSSRETALYPAVRRAAIDIINKGDDSVRIALPGDPSVTTAVTVVISGLTIGELATSTRKESSRYKVSERRVPNPEKSRAKIQLKQIEQMIASKRSECESTSDFDANKSQACVNDCMAKNSGLAGSLCGVQCRNSGGSSSAKSECNALVSEAESKLNEARSSYESISDTLVEDVYGDWSYARTDYARKVSANIETIATSAVGVRRSTDKLEYEASDYQVADDPAHNVQGHTSRRDFIDSPDAILPNLGERASTVAVERLKQAIQNGTIDAAVVALTRSGGTPMPGFETVDAMAWDVAGRRLQKAVRYGEKAATLELSSIGPSASDCALVVAVSTRADAQILIRTEGDRYADLRKKPFATLEICVGELTGGNLPKVEISGEDVRYALYRTRIGE